MNMCTRLQLKQWMGARSSSSDEPLTRCNMRGTSDARAYESSRTYQADGGRDDLKDNKYKKVINGQRRNDNVLTLAASGQINQPG